MTIKRELRFLQPKCLEVRSSADGKRTMSGYAALYNSRSADLGGFSEILAPGCFDRTLADPDMDVCALYGHDLRGGLLGRTTSGTLRLRSDSTGLAFECDLPNTTLGNDTAESISRGDVTGMSFGFSVVDDDWATAEDGTTVRTVRDLDLMEISATPWPAYPATSVQMRSLMFPQGLPDGFPLVEDEATPSDADINNKLLAAILDRRSR